jgi:hypothetical protein
VRLSSVERGIETVSKLDVPDIRPHEIDNRLRLPCKY